MPKVRQRVRWSRCPERLAEHIKLGNQWREHTRCKLGRHVSGGSGGSDRLVERTKPSLWASRPRQRFKQWILAGVDSRRR